MAELVKVFAAKLKDPSSIPRTYIMERENQFLYVVFGFPHGHLSMPGPTHKSICTHKTNK